MTDLLFNKSGDNPLDLLSESELEMIACEIPTFDLTLNDLGKNLNINDLLTTESQILTSKSEVRRAIQNNALKINKEKVSSGEDTISANQLLKEKYILQNQII